MYNNIKEAHNDFQEMVNNIGFKQKFGSITKNDEDKFTEKLFKNIDYLEKELKNIRF